MLTIKKGSRRTVILFNNCVIKVPRMTRWVSFITGIMENLHERYWWSADGSRKRNPKGKWTHDKLAEIYYADRFGFVVVMERLDTSFLDNDGKVKLECRKQFEEDLRQLEETTQYQTYNTDIAPRNVGYNKRGKLCVLDYGFFGGMHNAYLGT